MAWESHVAYPRFAGDDLPVSSLAFSFFNVQLQRVRYAVDSLLDGLEATETRCAFCSNVS